MARPSGGGTWAGGFNRGRFCLWLLALVTLAACGRTSQSPGGGGVPGDEPGSGGAINGGAGGTGFGAMGGGGSTGAGGPPLMGCNLGALEAPLVRYSSVDLEWSMDEIVGPGPSLERDGSESAARAHERFAHLEFVRDLLTSVEARVAAAALDESRLVVCDAEQDRSACVDSWIRERGLRSYRRPLTQAEVDGYVAQFSGLAGDSPLAAARAVLTAMLLSPYFVFRVELGVPTTTALAAPEPLPQPMLPPGTPLSDYEIAARLSHFLQRRSPDWPLLDRAASGDLRGRAGLIVEAQRLLATPESVRARVLSHLEWLGVDNLRVAGQPEELTKSLEEQTAWFVADVLQRRGGSFTELLTSENQPLNAALADHYQLSVDVGDAFELVALNPALHAGVLGQGAWLTRHPRPTYRGQHVVDRLLCSAVPPHPETLGVGEAVGTTPRERISSATAAPVCRGCHQMMDPIGFAFEAFDDQGRLTGFDTTGQLHRPDSGEVVPVQGPVELGQVLAGSEHAFRCAARRHVEQVLDQPYAGETAEALFACLASSSLEGGLDLNRLTLQTAISDAVLRIDRPAIDVATASAALDPLERAIEETAGLVSAFSDVDRAALEQYQESLRQVRAERAAP